MASTSESYGSLHCDIESQSSSTVAATDSLLSVQEDVQMPSISGVGLPSFDSRVVSCTSTSLISSKRATSSLHVKRQLDLPTIPAEVPEKKRRETDQGSSSGESSKQSMEIQEIAESGLCLQSQFSICIRMNHRSHLLLLQPQSQ